MNVALLVFAIIQQAQPAPEAPLPPMINEPSGLSASPANDAYYQEAPRPTPDAQRAIHAFGRCAAGNSAVLAAETLKRDFTSRRYRSGIDRIVRANVSCYRNQGRMAFSPLLLAGSLAEHLLERSGEPVNVMLARAAQNTTAAPYTAGDRIVLCAVRSLPDATAALLQSDPASQEEAAAADALQPALNLCAGNGPRLDATDAGLRAMIATAAYRTVHGGEQRASATSDER